MSASSSQHGLTAPNPSDSGDRVPDARRARASRWWLVGLGVPVALLAALATGCDQAPPPPAQKAVQVIVTRPIRQQVTDYEDFTGRLSAVKTVDIRARVTGYVDRVPYKEGDRVREGDLLFQIDPRQYQADLNQAEANLALAIADRDLQEKNAARARELVGSRAMATEDYQTAVATWVKARATVDAMVAARDRAKLYVTFTRVTSPVTGRISRRYVDPGNLVNADNTILTSIVTEDPMYAYFDVDERTYLDLAASASAEQATWLSGLQFPVLMSLANENQFTHQGTVNFIDNQVVATTGTVRMRGVFPNPKGTLKPGLFVRIRLPIGKPYPTLLIPDEAVLSDQGRNYVWVVNQQNEVEYRTVQRGQALGSFRAIKAAAKGKEGQEGLSLDDRVIVSGMQRVRKGSKVEVKEQPTSQPPPSLVTQVVASGSAPAARETAPSKQHVPSKRPGRSRKS